MQASQTLQLAWSSGLQAFLALPHSEASVNMTIMSGGFVWLPALGYPFLLAMQLPRSIIVAPSATTNPADEAWLALLASSLQLSRNDTVEPFVRMQAMTSAANDNESASKQGNGLSEETSAVEDSAVALDHDEDGAVSAVDRQRQLLLRQQLEALVVLCSGLGQQFDMRDSLRLLVSVMQQTPCTASDAMKTAISSLQQSIKANLRDLARLRTIVVDERSSNTISGPLSNGGLGRAHLTLIDRALRLAKDVNSVLEGGRSSKSD